MGTGSKRSAAEFPTDSRDQENGGTLELAGLPKTWRVPHVRVALVPIGGCHSVKLLEDATGRRIALVRLNAGTDASQAAARLGKGPLATRGMRVSYVPAANSCLGGVQHWMVHLDEVPDVHECIAAADPGCREVFVPKLPGAGHAGAQVQAAFLNMYGPVEEVFRPSDVRTGQPACCAYVRFAEHQAAEKCVASGAGSWSESERCLRTLVSEGPSIFLLEVGQALTAIARDADVLRLRICGDGLPPHGLNLQQSVRLHFVASRWPLGGADSISAARWKLLGALKENILQIRARLSARASSPEASFEHSRRNAFVPDLKASPCDLPSPLSAQGGEKAGPEQAQAPEQAHKSPTAIWEAGEGVASPSLGQQPGVAAEVDTSTAAVSSSAAAPACPKEGTSSGAPAEAHAAATTRSAPVTPPATKLPAPPAAEALNTAVGSGSNVTPAAEAASDGAVATAATAASTGVCEEASQSVLSVAARADGSSRQPSRSSSARAPPRASSMHSEDELHMAVAEEIDQPRSPTSPGRLRAAAAALGLVKRTRSLSPEDGQLGDRDAFLAPTAEAQPRVSGSRRMLRVRGIPNAWTTDDLEEYFARHGELRSARILENKQGGRLALVQFGSSADARSCAARLQGFQVEGNTLHARVWTPPQTGGSHSNMKAQSMGRTASMARASSLAMKRSRGTMTRAAAAAAAAATYAPMDKNLHVEVPTRRSETAAAEARGAVTSSAGAGRARPREEERTRRERSPARRTREVAGGGSSPVSRHTRGADGSERHRRQAQPRNSEVGRGRSRSRRRQRSRGRRVESRGEAEAPGRDARENGRSSRRSSWRGT